MNQRVATNITAALALAACLAVPFSASASASEGHDREQASASTSKVTLIVYPLLVRAPIMSASIELPSIPSIPGGGGSGGGGGSLDGASGSTDLSLNGAWMAGARVQADRWFGEVFGLYAALSASRAAPNVTVDSNTYFFNGRGGVRLLRGLSATAGFRRVSVDLDARLTQLPSGATLEARTKPALWDPLIGIDWRAPLSDRWRIEANFQGGGFGVGTDVDLSAEAYANWRVARHVELRAGYNLLHYKMTVANVSVGPVRRTVISKQTLHGPEFGIAIPF